MPVKVGTGSGRATQSAPPTEATNLFDDSNRQSVIYFNIAQQILVVTEDRLRLGMNNFLRREKKRREWYTPAGMLISEIAASVTSNFHRAAGVSGDQWQAIFYSLIALTLVWLIVTLTKMQRGLSVDLLIDSFKQCEQARGDSHAASASIIKEPKASEVRP